MEPSSFSRTTETAVSIAGSSSSNSGITAGTIAGRLFTSGLYRKRVSMRANPEAAAAPSAVRALAASQC